VKKICVIGTGYVGLVTGACFADLGNQVACVDIDPRKVEMLRRGSMPIYEPGLEEIVQRNSRAGRLIFTTSYAEGMADAGFIFISVDTPAGVEGDADMHNFRMAAETIAQHLDHEVIIVNKSTVPIGTGEWVAQAIQRVNGAAQFAVVSNPEFLREGAAVADFMNPDRVVLGSTNREAAQQVATLYASFQCPVIITDLATAEMVKYASNAFLATRISFINEIANICDKLGADVKVVSQGMGLDKRIGSSYLDAGLGYGGSCFPKDLKALEWMASFHGAHPQLLRAVMEINRDQRRMIVQRLRDLLGTLEGRVIGILGLSFKPGTDDVRDAPALEVARLLLGTGARVRGYDPAAMERASSALPALDVCTDAYAVADGADALVVCTEWNEFKQLDMERVRSLLRYPVLIDGRNLYDPDRMRQLGFLYYGIGRGGVRTADGAVERLATLSGFATR
jgi:UDPglucose 6-dehydrogenase